MSRGDMLTLLMLVVAGADFIKAGDVLLLEMSPGRVFPGCSPSMTLRCSRNSTLDAIHDMVIQGQGPIDETDLLWLSLLLEKDGHTVASVTVYDSIHEYTPAHLLTNDTRASAEGILLNAEEDYGYLQVTWTDPSAAQSGQYACIAHGQTQYGDPVTYSVSSRVDISEFQNDTGIVDALSYQVEAQRRTIDDHDGEISALNYTVGTLNSTVGTLNSTVSILTSTVGTLDEKVVVLVVEQRDIENEVFNHSSKLTSLKEETSANADDIYDLMEQNVTNTNDINSLKEQDVTHSNDINSLKQQNNDVIPKVDRLTEENQLQQQYINNLQEENAMQNQTIAQQSQAITKLNETITKLVKKQEACNLQIAFQAGMAGRSRTVIDRDQTVVFDITMLNLGGGYDNQTGVFTVPISGIYQFIVHGTQDHMGHIFANMKQNNDIVASMTVGYDNSNDDYYRWESGSMSAVVHAHAGDTVSVVAFSGSYFDFISWIPRTNMFNGFLVQADGCQPGMLTSSFDLSL